MPKKNVSSIEEQIEDWVKKYFHANNIQYLTKTEQMDSEIDDALKIESCLILHILHLEKGLFLWRKH